MNPSEAGAPVRLAEDVCALPLVRRLAAMLDRDPATLVDGDAMPRGWHVTLFNPPTPQSHLRADGAAGLGVDLPDIGLPRLMLGGRSVRFAGDIPIGAHVRRETRQGGVRMKEGRSGRFALVNVEHRIFTEGASEAVLVESNDYVLREAGGAASAPADVPPAAPVTPHPTPDATLTILPDERLLFRYSAITDNPHRIHFDAPYATGAEAYPALVVNGSIPAMFLLEMFRSSAGREPALFESRNVAPMYCGRRLHLYVRRQDDAWRLWAEDDAGRATFEAQAQ